MKNVLKVQCLEIIGPLSQIAVAQFVDGREMDRTRTLN